MVFKVLFRVSFSNWNGLVLVASLIALQLKVSHLAFEQSPQVQPLHVRDVCLTTQQSLNESGLWLNKATLYYIIYSLELNF